MSTTFEIAPSEPHAGLKAGFVLGAFLIVGGFSAFQAELQFQ